MTTRINPLSTHRFFLAMLLLCMWHVAHTQPMAPNQPRRIRGVVLEQDSKGTFKPLIGAAVVWLHSTLGTTTDTNGVFVLEVPAALLELPETARIVVSYLGYQSDTLAALTQDKLRVILAESDSKILQEVEVSYKLGSTYLNMLDARQTQVMTEKELYKAACCNLSESFETNPSVDVQYADAVSGAKQIQMLGLSGIYTQLTYENLPGNRGLGASYGLGFTPGPWIESIQITKGTGSVANGYESMAGQINVELKKPYIAPQKSDPVFVNLFANDMGRAELNTHFTQRIAAGWSQMTQLHLNTQYAPIDVNADGFLDIPLGSQANLLHRWRYEKQSWIVQVGARALYDDRLGGQTTFDPQTDRGTTRHYGIGMRTGRAEAFAKAGYVFPHKKYRSLGAMIQLTNHHSDQYFGLLSYGAHQQSLYANWIYQDIIGSTRHKYRTGISYVADSYGETLQAQAYTRQEHVPGAFVEHTWLATDKWQIISGLRADYHSLFGPFVTPRLHAKYDLGPFTQLRLSAGRGQRTANLLAENTVILASSRRLFLPQDIRGLGTNEVSWNYGGSLQHEYLLFGQIGTLVLDAYSTRFVRQLVADYDLDPQQIHFYNLQGRSYAHSMQAEANYEPLPNLELRLAYRWYDVQTQYRSGMLQRPLIARHRWLMHLGYQTPNQWKVDLTLNWNGAKRIPATATNPPQYQFPGTSPAYTIVHAQVSKQWRTTKAHTWDLYLGSENLTNFRQQQLIVAPQDPFGPYFDASLVWGPVIGRMVYGGLRYTWNQGKTTQL